MLPVTFGARKGLYARNVSYTFGEQIHEAVDRGRIIAGRFAFNELTEQRGHAGGHFSLWGISHCVQDTACYNDEFSCQCLCQ
jgi:hypothetical protein